MEYFGIGLGAAASLGVIGHRRTISGPRQFGVAEAGSFNRAVRDSLADHSDLGFVSMVSLVPFRRRVNALLDHDLPPSRASRVVGLGIDALIVINVGSVILESV